MWKKTTFSTRKLEDLWINNIYSSHDLWCDCSDVQLHFLQILNRNSEVKKPLEDIVNIKCLLTGPTTETATATETDIGLEDGELEKLFAEDTETPTG